VTEIVEGKKREWINRREGKNAGMSTVSTHSRASLPILPSAVVLDCGLSSISLPTKWAKTQ